MHGVLSGGIQRRAFALEEMKNIHKLVGARGFARLFGHLGVEF